MFKKPDLTQLTGWVIVDPRSGNATEYFTWKEVLDANDKMKGHLMSKEFYENVYREINNLRF
jgi:hypothetical protein